VSTNVRWAQVEKLLELVRSHGLEQLFCWAGQRVRPPPSQVRGVSAYSVGCSAIQSTRARALGELSSGAPVFSFAPHAPSLLYAPLFP
jgi:hypothetical protein